MGRWMVVGVLMAGCGGAAEGTSSSALGVGDACVPELERQTTFSGFSSNDVVLETGNPACETRLCLVNHFQARVSCPYGQDESTAETWQSAASWDTGCSLPGTDGARPEDRVRVSVPPQYFVRQAEDAVYCSCRCANGQGRTDDGADYCECDAGFVCAHLVDDLGLGAAELAGSYCIREGSEYDEVAAAVSPLCDPDSHSPYYCDP